MFFVYILQSEVDGTYYKGFTTDLEIRLQRHNNGESKYTSTKRPLKMVYAERHEGKSAALKRERSLKRSNSQYIEWLIAQPTNILLQ